MTAISGVYKDNLVDMIGQLANTGQDDPTIASRLEITTNQVRRLRKEFDIPAGERRWLPVRPVSSGGDTTEVPGD